MPVFLQAQHKPSRLPSRFYLMQLGPDGKIYINCPAGVNVLHGIENPNEPRDACNVIQHGIQLPTYNLVSMPNFPNYRLGALPAGACDTTTAILNPPESIDITFQINPNPASFYTTLEFSNLNTLKPSAWEIYSSTGQLILKGRATSDRQEVDVTQWPSGVYFVKVILSEGNYISEKLVVQPLGR